MARPGRAWPLGSRRAAPQLLVLCPLCRRAVGHWAAAASELAQNFEDDDTFVVPEVDWSRTGPRVLTLDRVNAISLGSREALIDAGVDR